MFANETKDWLEDAISEFAVPEHRDLIRPGFGRGSIADIPNLLKRNLGISTGQGVPDAMRGAEEDVDHMVFFLLDGFGHSTVEKSLASFEMHNLRSYLDYSDYVPITSVFPSTTSTATVTYQTGLQPMEHGIIGYNSYLAELGSVCNMITLTPLGRPDYSLLDHGWSVPAIRDSGTIYEQLKRNYVEPFLYLPNAIRGSGMTNITGTGANFNGYFSVSHMLTTLRRNIENSVRKSFHFCYISSVDTISHKIGPYTEETSLEVDSIFQLINGQFLENLRADGRVGIAISADHGHTVVPQSRILDIRDDPVLSSMMRAPVTGDVRAPVLRLRAGLTDRAVKHLEHAYGDLFLVRRKEELVRDSYFGTRIDSFSDTDRLGDIILIPTGDYGMKDSCLGMIDPKLNRIDMTGMHGGLSREEMIVPLIYRTIEGKP